MRVLVTGGAGFVGAAVVRALLDAGHEPVVLDALWPKAHGPAGARPPYLEAGVALSVGDVRDPVAVAAVLAGADAVCHQAAVVGLGTDLGDLPDYVGVNDLGTAVLLRAMAESRVRRLVLASSMVVYGEGRYRCAGHGLVRPGPRRREDLEMGRFEPPCPRCGRPLEPGQVPEDAPVDPRNVYAATKTAQEHLAGAWSRVTGGTVAALRYHNVYGAWMPRDTPYAGVASLFRSALEVGQAPRVFEDGRQRRDFVHVTDVARANVLALEAGYDGALNVCSGEPRTVGDMAAQLASALAGPTPVVTGEYRLGDVRHVVADPARARQELGFAAVVPFADGVAGFARAPLRAAVPMPTSTTAAATP